jgi:hypothetical protein
MIPIREFYVACRADHGVRESIKLTAEYRGISESEVCDALGFESSTCLFPGCETAIPLAYSKVYPYCPFHMKRVLGE